MSIMQKRLRKLLQFVVSTAMFIPLSGFSEWGLNLPTSVFTDCTRNFGSAQCHNGGLPNNIHYRFWRHVLLALCASQEPWT